MTKSTYINTKQVLKGTAFEPAINMMTSTLSIAASTGRSLWLEAAIDWLTYTIKNKLSMERSVLAFQNVCAAYYHK